MRNARTSFTDGDCPAATDMAAGHGGSSRAIPGHALLLVLQFKPPCRSMILRLAANAPSGLQPLASSNLFPGMYRHCWRPSNWLHRRSRQVPPSRPLDTGLGAPRRALWVVFGRWHDRGVVAASSKRTPFIGTRSFIQSETHADAPDAVVRLRYNWFPSKASPRPPTRYNARASFRIMPTNAALPSPRRCDF